MVKLAGKAFLKWTCVFPGKGGFSWKRVSSIEGTREEAEIEAAKWCNVVAVPLELWNNLVNLNESNLLIYNLSAELKEAKATIKKIKEMGNI